ncbi:hypothetical protein BKA70DRAFT_641655 [Coprinopsis sp. MPI-PUGE-AT-0042]|nr:hypothetical protein BKA70DRAFT_641655 [Coprinopsis sp. MPI-PUGE-AT-0042]
MHITEGRLHSRGSDAAAAVKRQDAPTPPPTIQTPHGIDGDASRVEAPSLRSELVRNDDPPATPLPDRTSSQVDGNANRIQPLPRTNETDNTRDRPATGIARANDAPEPQAPLATQPLDESDKPKGLLSVTGSLLQMVLKKVPDAVDSNPVKVFFSLAKIILQFKEGMEDNKDAIKQDMDAYAAQIATIEAAQADWKDGDAPEETEAMDEFKKEVAKQLAKLVKIKEQSRFRNFALLEEDKKEIARIFKGVDEARERLIVATTARIHHLVAALQADFDRLLSTQLKVSSKADYLCDLDGKEAALGRSMCTHGTRTSILEAIIRWATDLSDSQCIFWLSGHAGTGKTTIGRHLLLLAPVSRDTNLIRDRPYHCLPTLTQVRGIQGSPEGTQ